MAFRVFFGVLNKEILFQFLKSQLIVKNVIDLLDFKAFLKDSFKAFIRISLDLEICVFPNFLYLWKNIQKHQEAFRLILNRFEVLGCRSIDCWELSYKIEVRLYKYFVVNLIYPFYYLLILINVFVKGKNHYGSLLVSFNCSY